jgi:hypothetical protein
MLTRGGEGAIHHVRPAIAWQGGLVSTYHTVLYLHLLFLLAGMGAATMMALVALRLRAAETLADAVPWGMLASKTEKVFPVVVLGLFGTGAYMTSDLWTWSTRWIDVSIAGLVILALQGPLLAGRRAEMLKHALQENGPGPLGERARRLARDPGILVATFANPAIVLGIIWNMTQKPGTAGAVAAVLVAYAVGAAVGLRLSRLPAVQASAVTEPAA